MTNFIIVEFTLKIGLETFKYLIRGYLYRLLMLSLFLNFTGEQQRGRAS